MNTLKTVTRDIFVHYSKYQEDNIVIYNFDMSTHGDALLGKVSITFEIPQTDPVVAQIEMLEKALEKLQIESHAKALNIKEQIQSLLAIAHCVTPIVDDCPF